MKPIKNEKQLLMASGIGIQPDAKAKATAQEVVNFTTSQQTDMIMHLPSGGLVVGHHTERKPKPKPMTQLDRLQARLDTLHSELHDLETEPAQQSLFGDSDVETMDAMHDLEVAITDTEQAIIDAVQARADSERNKPKPKPKPKGVLAEINAENERMTRREFDTARHGKNRTERTGSSVRVLNRIALHECGHGMNGGGTRKEVTQAGQWQSEFKVNGDQTGRGGSTSATGTHIHSDKETK